MNEDKASVQQYWDARPCGFGESKAADTASVLLAHSRLRYEREPEIPGFAEFGRWKGRRVLEIGVGIGADYVQFRRAGAIAIGMDLSSQSLRLARQNLAINGLAGDLSNSDAESLPFAADAFDLVYSWGVLHHTPNMEAALDEVHRVLRPSGECRIMLYHRQSLVALQCIQIGRASCRERV